MTPDDVLQLAERFEDLVPVLPMHWDRQEASGTERYNTMALSRGGTSIVLGFRRGRLETFRLTWVSGIKQQSVQMRENLCTNRRAARVKISVTNLEFYGRRFEIDGVDLGQLPESPRFQRVFWIEAGEHLLRVFDEQGQTIGEMTFTIDDDLSKGSHYVLLEGVQQPGA